MVLGIAAPLVARYLPELVRAASRPWTRRSAWTSNRDPDVVDLLVRNLILFGGVAAVLLAMGSVAGEQERGTAALVLSPAGRRTAFLVREARRRSR